MPTLARSASLPSSQTFSPQSTISPHANECRRGQRRRLPHAGTNTPRSVASWKRMSFAKRTAHEDLFVAFPFVAQRRAVTEQLENVAGRDAGADGSCIFRYRAVSDLAERCAAGAHR